MDKSIIENFAFRVFTQESLDSLRPFPIKLIRTAFTNAAKLSRFAGEDVFDTSLLEDAAVLRIKLESVVEMAVNRIKLCVAKPDYEIEKSENDGLPNGMWMYPVVAVRQLRFQPLTGEIYIQLYRQEDNVRQLYSLNPGTRIWEKVKGVEKLSQLYLRRSPSMREILFNNMPDLCTLRKFVDMDITSDMLKAKDYMHHTLLWRDLLPLLPALLRDVSVLMAQYEIMLSQRN